MAMASNPSVGTRPMTFPQMRAVFDSAFLHGERERPHRTRTRRAPEGHLADDAVNPSNATKMKYGMRNAAPPNSATRYGNSQMLAVPTALPTHP